MAFLIIIAVGHLRRTKKIGMNKPPRERRHSLLPLFSPTDNFPNASGETNETNETGVGDGAFLTTFGFSSPRSSAVFYLFLYIQFFLRVLCCFFYEPRVCLLVSFLTSDKSKLIPQDIDFFFFVVLCVFLVPIKPRFMFIIIFVCVYERRSAR